MRQPLKVLFDQVWEQRKVSDWYKERKIIYLESDRVTDVSKLWYREGEDRPYLLAQGYRDVKDKLTDFLIDFSETP